MLEFPRWKIAFVIIVLAFFSLAALPNVIPEENRGHLPFRDSVPLGLDLRGGSHLLLELNFPAYMREHMGNVRDALRQELRVAKVGYVGLHASAQEITLRVRPETVGRDVNLNALLRKVDPEASVARDGDKLRLYYDERAIRKMQSHILEQSIEIVNRRVNESGTKEPVIQRQGSDRIVVQVPGLQDPKQLKALLGKTAKMTFHLVNESVGGAHLEGGIAPPGTRLLPSDDPTDIGYDGRPLRYPVYSQVALSGEHLTGAQATYQNGMPVVSFQFNTLGAQKFGEITQKNIGRRFAVVLDNKVITAPVIRSAIIGGSGIIEGNFTVESANQLAILLRAGALPAPLNVIEERSVGPSLGQDSIEAGIVACAVGIALVVVFMLLSYGLFGIFANIALTANLVIILGAMSLMHATLTLPGIAGIVLSLGMAVDANVLIFERIRDMMRAGHSALASIEAGFKLAFGTIVDSNITTLIAAALLFYFGSGSVKGFAVTLTIGILASMFTAILFTRLLIVLWVRRTRPRTIPI